MTTVDLAATQTHDEPSCLAHPDGTRRRALLGVAVAVGAVCAGCSSSKNSSAPPATSQSSTGSAASSTGSASTSSSSSDAGSAAPSSSASASSASSGSAAALAATSAVPVGGGTILADQKIVLTQPTAGTFKAFTAVCTHQGCVVGTIQNGLIVCPCHGSAYHIADGSVANGPAPRALAAIPIKVAGGQITQA